MMSDDVYDVAGWEEWLVDGEVDGAVQRVNVDRRRPFCMRVATLRTSETAVLRRKKCIKWWADY